MVTVAWTVLPRRTRRRGLCGTRCRTLSHSRAPATRANAARAARRVSRYGPCWACCEPFSRARSWVRVLVLVVVAQPVHDALFFLTAERREIEQVVGVEQRVEAALVGRVGVEDAIAIAEEHAQAFPLAFVRPALGLRGDRRVVVDGVLRVERHTKVVVEVGPVRRQPRERPAH